MTWDWTLPLVFNVAGSVAIAAFGVLVALVRPRTPQATVVAVFSVAFGLATALVNLALAPGTTTVEAGVLGWSAGMAGLVATVATGIMWWALPVPVRPRGVQFVGALVLAGFAAVLLTMPVLLGQATGSSVAALPHLRLYFAVAGVHFGAWCGLILLLAARLRSESDARRGQAALLAGALALYPSNSTQYLFSADVWFALLSRVTFLFAVVAAVTWLWAGERAGQPRVTRNVVWIILGMALLGTVAGTIGGDVGGGVGLSGVARIATVAILSYGVIRHHALGIDAKLRFGISKSTIAAVFIAVFFIASEVAQQFFGEQFESNYLGILAAGALVFAIAPLSRLADRLAEMAVPPVVTTDVAADPRREEMYRTAVRLALRDRRLTRSEERELFHLAGGLGLGPERAHEILAETEDLEGTTK